MFEENIVQNNEFYNMVSVVDVMIKNNLQD